MKGVILLMLLGACWGLRANLEYKYRYSGRVASGIPSLLHQFAGAGLQADVTVQVTGDHKIFFKLDNIEVGEYHDVLECDDTQAPLPIHYHPLVEGKELLEKPFEYHGVDSPGKQCLKLPEEPVWITNIKKSIVGIFGIPPILGTFRRNPNIFAKSTFSVKEDSLHGDCFSWYSLFRVPEEEAARENRERDTVVEQDVQRDEQDLGSYTSSKVPSKTTSKTTKTTGTKTTGTKTTGTKTGTKTPSPEKLTAPDRIDNTLWYLSRTVDFDSCEDLVKWEIHGNTNTDHSIRRTSIATYLLRGNHRDIRIEYALIEGSVSAFTSSVSEEHITTFTNQTLELRAVRRISRVFAIDYPSVNHNSFHYEVDHLLTDLQEPGHELHPSLEQLVTGVPIDGHGITEIKNLVISHLDLLAKRTTTFPYSKDPLVKDLKLLVEAAGFLSRPEIESVFSQIGQGEHQDRKQNIFYEVLIAAGTEPAISYILEKISDLNFRKAHDPIAQNFFDTIHLSVKNPLLVPKILDVVKELSWDEDDQVLVSTALLNFATLAYELCLSSDKREVFSDNTCDSQHTCNPDIVFDSYLPALTQGVQDEEFPVWIRLVYLQALINLRTPQTIDVLKPIALGTKNENIILRVNAIVGLSGVYVPRTAYNVAFDILMPVFENIGENTEVRIAAFIALSYMEPSIGWWTRVAVSTWHEPSSQVANYVSATITARAHGTSPVSKNAARVVHLIKPPVTLSLSHSASIFFQDILSNCEVDAVLSIGWLTSAKGLFPSKVFLRLTMKAFFGFSEETKAQIGQGEINALIRRLYGLLQIESHKDARGTEGEIVQEMFGEILEQLGFAHTATKSDLMIYLKLMDTVVALPILKDYTQVIQAAVTSVKDSFPHTGRETDFSLVVPTDLGLPFIIEYTSDYSYWIDGTSTGTQLRPAKTKSTFTFIFEVSVDKTLLTKTLLPWSNKFAVGAGVHNAHAVILPLKGYFVLDTQKHEIKLSIEAQHSSKVLLKNSHNFPYTVVTGPFPTALHPQQSDYKKIRITKEETFQRHTQALPDIYGISVESSWSGDFEFPLNLHSLSQDLDPFTPSYKSWDYRLEWDPQASTTKSITITLTYVTSESSGESEELVQVGQETQGAADFGDFSQVSNGGEQEFQEGSRDFQEIGDLELETFGQQQQQTNYRQRIEKLQEEVMPISGGYVKSISIGLDLQGSTSRSYETVLTWAVGSSAGQHSTKIHFTIISNPPEGTFEDPHAICFDVLVLKPKFTPLTTVEDLLTSNLQTIIEAQIYDGVSCKGSPVLEGQGYLDASEAVINHLKEELAKECDPDTSHLRLIDIITSSLYDHANFKAQWTEDYPLVLRNLSNHLNDYFEGILFPLVSYDHTATNPEHAREIDATKTLDTNHWTIRDVRPHLVAVTHDLKLPALIEEFLGPAQMYKTFIYNYIQGRTPSKCNIETTKVRTYDGVSFPYQADSCWVTAVLSHSGAEETQSYDYVISVRFTEEWEVRVLWPWAGFNYDITKSVLLVNGEELKKGDKFVNFIQQETGSLVIFKRLGFLIVISDKLTIGKPNELIGNINGLCGRLDGEKRHDLVGPTGCIFTNPSLFALSWTTQGEGCSLFSLRSKKRGVTQYQEACPREDYIPTAVSHPNVVYDCTQWEYKERTVGNLICDAIEPTPSCKPNCKKTRDISKDLNYDCKKLVSTQTEAYCQQSQGRNLTRECHPHTLLTTYPASCVPQ